MKKKSYQFSAQFYGGLLVTFLGSIALLLAVAVNGPDRELHFTREVPSDLSPERLDRNFSALSRWPQWFYSMTVANSTTGKTEPGTIVKLNMDPHKGKKKQFELTTRVEEYVPQRKLTLAILDDSSGRLTRIFDRLEWDIELVPTEKGSLIKAHARAHTCHWRSRLFGLIAERILMNQVFYPNVLKLSQLRQPFSLDLPQQQGMLSP